MGNILIKEWRFSCAMVYILCFSIFNFSMWSSFVAPLATDFIVSILFKRKYRGYVSYFIKLILLAIAISFVSRFVWYEEQLSKDDIKGAAFVYPIALILFVIESGVLLVTLTSEWNNFLFKISRIMGRRMTNNSKEG